MSFVPDLQDQSPPPFGPALMVGAASPLWAYFSGVAATGVAWWWMTRLAPQNLEAMFAAFTPERTAQGPAPAVETVLEAALSPQPEPEPEPEPLPVVGGEAAPISPVLADVPPEPRTIGVEPEPASPRPRRATPAPPIADA